VRLRSLALCIPLLLTLAAAPVPEHVVKPGKPIIWDVEQFPRPVRFRAGSLRFLLKPVWPEKDLVGARITIFSLGRRPFTITSEESIIEAPTTIWVGRWNRAGQPFVVIDTYSGGAHCCDDLRLLIPERDRFRVVDLGSYDGIAIPSQPKDLDGDGRIDFLVDDEEFIDTFAGHAESLAPPKILNVVNGRVVDVSARHSFAPIFRRDMADTRKRCLSPKSNPQRNGPCAAYVADAARVGQFHRAWKEMLRVYDHSWKNYPDDLRAFLQSLGYID
jgi:hypothetical protein